MAVLKCLICGKTSMPGAKLCADCSSARKRAFAATVTQPLLAAAGVHSERSLLRPSQSVAATVRRSAERARALTLPVEAPTQAQAVSRHLEWMIIAFALVALAVVVVIVAWQRHVVRVAGPLPVAEAEGARVVPAPSMTLVPAELAPKSVAEMPPVPSHDATPVGEASPPKPEVRRAAAKPKVAAEPPPPVIEAPPPAVAVAPAPPPALPKEMPVIDPMQQMRDALAQCSGGVFDRILCDQRVRREYCEGRWGQVPQCASGVSNDHGQ